MTAEEFTSAIISFLPFTPNDQQAQVAAALARFCARSSACSEDRVFILNGYAGTGKTSLVAALVRVLKKLQRPVVLLAPTGRAAKVFALYAGHPAFRNILPHYYWKRLL